MALVQVQNLTKYFGTRELFRDISFEVFEQDHIGLIGVNGCGKTTLLSLLLRQQEADAGTLSAGLFAALRELDDPAIHQVYARCPVGGGVAYAVQNRLKKAAAFHIVDAEVEE